MTGTKKTPKKLTRDELLHQLRELAQNGDPEAAHIQADDLLLAFIADKDVTDAFEAIPKWYA